MEDNNKNVRRPKIKDDPAEHIFTIRMRRSHLARFESMQSRDTIGKFVGDLVENFFEHQDYRKKFPLFDDPVWILNINDYVAAAGNRIDAEETEKCLIAWLDDKPLPSFTPTKELEDLYNWIIADGDDIYDNATEIDLMKVSEDVLDTMRDIYYQYKSLHFNVYKILSEILNSHQCAGLDRKNIVEQLNEIVNLEYVAMNFHCVSSPSLRFSVYQCWRHGILEKRAKRPKWVRFAGQELAAMNQLIRDKSS